MKKKILARMLGLSLSLAVFVSSIPVTGVNAQTAAPQTGYEVTVSDNATVLPETEETSSEKTGSLNVITSVAEDSSDSSSNDGADDYKPFEDFTKIDREETVPSVFEPVDDYVNTENDGPDLNEEYLESGDIFDFDWENATDEQIDTVAGATNWYDLGEWIDQMSDAEEKELLSRDTVLTQETTFYEEDPSTGEVVESETEIYYEYALDEYEENKGQNKKLTYFDQTSGSFKMVFKNSGSGATYTMTFKISGIDKNNWTKNKNVNVAVTTSGTNFCSAAYAGGATSYLYRYNQSGSTYRIFPAKVTHSKLPGYVERIAYSSKDSDKKYLTIFAPKSTSDLLVTDSSDHKNYIKMSKNEQKKYRFPTAATMAERAANGVTYAGAPNLNNYQASGTVTTYSLVDIMYNSTAGQKKGDSWKKATTTKKGKQLTSTITFVPSTYNVVFNGNGATAGSNITYNNVTYPYTGYRTPAISDFAREYTVAFNPNGGECSVGSLNAKYNLNGWSGNSSVKAINLGTSATFNSLTTKHGETVTLSAKWTGGTITLPTPTREGYTFAGWYNGASKIGDAGSIITITKNMTLSAKWTANTYYVELWDVSPTDATSKVKLKTLECTYDQIKTLPTVWEGANEEEYLSICHVNPSEEATEEEKTWPYSKNHPGYVFEKWTTATGKDFLDATSFENLTATNGASIALYAKYRAGKSNWYVEYYLQKRLDADDTSVAENYKEMTEWAETHRDDTGSTQTAVPEERVGIEDVSGDAEMIGELQDYITPPAQSVFVSGNESSTSNYKDPSAYAGTAAVVKFYYKLVDYRCRFTVNKYYQDTPDGVFKLYTGTLHGEVVEEDYNSTYNGWMGYKAVPGTEYASVIGNFKRKSDVTYVAPNTETYTGEDGKEHYKDVLLDAFPYPSEDGYLTYYLVCPETTDVVLNFKNNSINYFYRCEAVHNDVEFTVKHMVETEPESGEYTEFASTQHRAEFESQFTAPISQAAIDSINANEQYVCVEPKEITVTVGEDLAVDGITYYYDIEWNMVPYTVYHYYQTQEGGSYDKYAIDTLLEGVNGTTVVAPVDEDVYELIQSTDGVGYKEVEPKSITLSTISENSVTYYYNATTDIVNYPVYHYIQNEAGGQYVLFKEDTCSAAYGNTVTPALDTEAVAKVNTVENCVCEEPQLQTVTVNTDLAENGITYYYTCLQTKASYKVEHYVPVAVNSTDFRLVTTDTETDAIGTIVTPSLSQQAIDAANAIAAGYACVLPPVQTVTVKNNLVVRYYYTITKGNNVVGNNYYNNYGLSDAQAKALIAALENGSVAQITVNGVTYKIMKNPDGTLTIKLAEVLAGQTKITIPSGVQIGDLIYPITEIEKNCFKGNKTLKEVTIGSNIAKIGDSAFEGCTALEKVIMQEGVVTIGNAAFKGCSALKEVKLPSSVQTIGDSAFENCTSLISLTLNNGLLTIGEKAFYNCKNLPKVVIPDSVLKMGKYAFAKCAKLKSVTTSAGCTTMGTGVFSDCTSLTKITLKAALTAIPSKAFYNCKKLKTVKMGKKVATIGSSAFKKCTSLKTVKLGSGVTEIGTSAFEGCKKMTKITIPNKVMKIKSKAFFKCSKLGKVTIKSKVISSVGSKAFKKCKKGIKFAVPYAKKSTYAKLFKGKY